MEGRIRGNSSRCSLIHQSHCSRMLEILYVEFIVALAHLAPQSIVTPIGSSLSRRIRSGYNCSHYSLVLKFVHPLRLLSLRMTQNLPTCNETDLTDRQSLTMEVLMILD
jgi:hypothetical protein